MPLVTLEFCRAKTEALSPLVLDFTDDPCGLTLIEEVTLLEVPAGYIEAFVAFVEDVTAADDVDGIRVYLATITEQVNARDRNELTAGNWSVDITESVSLDDVIAAPRIVVALIDEVIAATEELVSGRIGPFATMSNADVCSLGLTHDDTKAVFGDTANCQDNLAEKITLPKL